MKSLRFLGGLGCLLGCLILAGLQGCAKAPLKSESLLDTPQTHVDQGLRLLDRGELDGARAEFDRALGLDPKYYMAHAAKALLLAETPEGGKVALKTAREAVDMADNRWQAWMIQARVLSRVQPEDWYKDSQKSLEKAAELGAPAEQVSFWRGRTAMENLDFQTAVSEFGVVVSKRGDWSAPADKAMATCNTILRAKPGTRVSSKIALVEKIDRADMAVLLVEELKLPEVMDKRKKPANASFSAPDAKTVEAERLSPADIQSHWAKSWIEDVLRVNGMGLGAAGAFEPEATLSRGEFAMIVTDILVAVSGDPKLATAHFGETSMFPDLSSSHPSYNAAALCASRGILQADLSTGNFQPVGSVSGAEALLGIRQFQNILRQSF
ncbi:MAG: S-layer homology domain-containing protein [Candidatus Delongbacteria bacterium]